MKRQVTGVLRCWLLIMAGVLAASVVALGPAQAITNGQPDGNRHPNVGLMVVNFGSGPEPWCTGTLIAPTRFLTAAHCIAFLQQFGGTVDGVTFDPQTFDPSTSTVIPAQETAVDPAFGHDQGDFHDLAVITLSRVAPAALAALPTAGLLDQLAAKGGLRGQQFTNVGYGATGIAHGGGKPVPILDFMRRFSTPPFMALRNTVLFLLLNTNATGQGGNCFFDSGSPVFLNTGSGDVLVAVVSLKADQACVANGFNYRLDTPSARAFLGQFVTLP
jgi:secreted trypsin-like serine protease